MTDVDNATSDAGVAESHFSTLNGNRLVEMRFARACALESLLLCSACKCGAVQLVEDKQCKASCRCVCALVL